MRKINMLSNRVVLILLSILLIIALSADNGTFVKAEESGECVAGTDGETCVNPDVPVETNDAEAAAEHEVREEETPPPLEEAATEQEQPQEPVATESPEEEERAETVEDERSETVEEAQEPVEEADTPPAKEPRQQQEESQVEADASPESVPPSEEEPPKEEVVDTPKSPPAERVPEKEEEEEENTPSCPSRKHVIKCAGEYLDTNNNSYLERSELQAAIDNLSWLSRGILNILGSVDKMMQKCDVDGDDAIGMDYDMTHNSETCLATCFKRRAFKAAFFPHCEA